jgi:hypothetical protein
MFTKIYNVNTVRRKSKKTTENTILLKDFFQTID